MPGCAAAGSAAAGVNRSSAVPTCPAAVATRGPSAARAARSRRSENDAMQTRSVAPVPQHLPDRRLERRVGLDVDVDPDVRELLEQLGEERDRLARRRSEPRGRRRRGARRSPRGASDTRSSTRVVERDELAVAGRVHVGLDVAVAHVDGPAERREGVLQAAVRPVARHRPGAPGRPGSARRGRGSRRRARQATGSRTHDRGVGRHGPVVGQRARRRRAPRRRAAPRARHRGWSPRAGCARRRRRCCAGR